jgi:hypothetical protein
MAGLLRLFKKRPTLRKLAALGATASLADVLGSAVITVISDLSVGRAFS